MSARPPSPGNSSTIPAAAGIGLRAAHHQHFATGRPDAGWLEVHSENFLVEGGPALAFLRDVRANFPISLHGVGLGLGSTDPLDERHLRGLRRLVRQIEPGLVSEHLCFCSVEGRHTNDLLPMPYTDDALDHIVRRVDAVQNYLKRQILVENVSTYLEFACSTHSESGILSELARRSGCGILLDVNNVYVSACNHGFDAVAYLRDLPANCVKEIHLAGHSIQSFNGRAIRVDTHDGPVCDAVWSLYAAACTRFGPQPTLIEWDAELPALTVLLDEANKANTYLEQAHDLAA